MPQHPVFGVDHGHKKTFYYNPPSWFIPKIIYEFYERHCYYKEYGGAPAFENQNDKFFYLSGIFRSSLSEFRAEKAKLDG